tara:strand:- start:48 stop:383 length:336 start_codon:yes stop_codon:yes gene_type:complete
LVATSTADRKFIHRDDPTIARATANVASSIEPVDYGDAGCRTYQQTLWAHEATALRYVGVIHTQEIEGCAPVVRSVLGKSVQSMCMSVRSDWAERNASLPGQGQVLEAEAK